MKNIQLSIGGFSLLTLIAITLDNPDGIDIIDGIIHWLMGL